MVAFALQETRMSPAEFQAFTRLSRKKGFRIYGIQGQPGKDRFGHDRARGGVAWLVDNRLQSRQCQMTVRNHSQMCSIYCEGFLLMNFYSPPSDGDPQFDVACGMVDTLISEALPAGHDWMAVGDANETPSKSTIHKILQNWQGHVVSPEVPTRWDSDREIDWMITNNPRVCNHVSVHDVHLSDHKLVSWDVLGVHVDLSVGSLSKVPDWSRPENISTLDWRSCLDSCWDSLGFTDIDCEGDVQVCWDQYMTALNTMFSRAFQTLHAKGLISALELRKRLNHGCSKGHLPQWKPATWSRTKNISAPGSMRLLKHRKRLARLFELRRFLGRPQGWYQHRHVVDSLFLKLGLEFFSYDQGSN